MFKIRTCGFPAYGSCLGWVTAQVAVYAPAPLTRDPGSESSRRSHVAEEWGPGRGGGQTWPMAGRQRLSPYFVENQRYGPMDFTFQASLLVFATEWWSK